MKKEILSTFDAAKLCQVHPGTIKNWIRKENLKAFKTPGGHRRIYKRDLDNFLNEYNFPVRNVTNDQRGKVLIVDKDHRSRKKIAKYLSGWTGIFEVAMASNCLEAGEMLVMFKPDIVLIDNSMPGMDTENVCSHIKNSIYLDNPKILLLTKDTLKKVPAEKIDGYLFKPFTRTKLLSELTRVAGIKKY